MSSILLVLGEMHALKGILIELNVVLMETGKHLINGQ